MAFENNTALTFVDNITTAEPIGTVVDFSFNTKQNLSQNTTRSLGSKQSLFQSTTKTLGSKQSLFQNTSRSLGSKQVINKDIQMNVNSEQKVYKTQVSQLDTKQPIFAIKSRSSDIKQVLFNGIVKDFSTLQDIFNNSVVRVWNNSVNISFYKEVTKSNFLKQEVFVDRQKIVSTSLKSFSVRRSSVSTKQSRFVNRQTIKSLKQVVFADKNTSFDTFLELFNQSVLRVTENDLKIIFYKQEIKTFPTVQLIFKLATGYSDLKQVIVKNTKSDFPSKQIVLNSINQKISTLQRMAKETTVDLDVLINMDSDYKIYKQVIEEVVFIQRNHYDSVEITRIINQTFNI